MTTTQKVNSWFSPKLRAAMERKSESVRSLARAWRPEDDPETSRRSLNRYLNRGVVPGQAIRRELAEALGVDPSLFEQDEEEEADLVMDLFNRLIDRRLEQKLRELEREREGTTA